MKRKPPMTALVSWFISLAVLLPSDCWIPSQSHPDSHMLRTSVYWNRFCRRCLGGVFSGHRSKSETLSSASASCLLLSRGRSCRIQTLLQVDDPGEATRLANGCLRAVEKESNEGEPGDRFKILRREAESMVCGFS